jgi:hypothetical protein
VVIRETVHVPATTPASTDILTQLERISALLSSGVINEGEAMRLKEKLLGGGSF